MSSQTAGLDWCTGHHYRHTCRTTTCQRAKLCFSGGQSACCWSACCAYLWADAAHTAAPSFCFHQHTISGPPPVKHACELAPRRPCTSLPQRVPLRARSPHSSTDLLRPITQSPLRSPPQARLESSCPPPTLCKALQEGLESSCLPRPVRAHCYRHVVTDAQQGLKGW